MFAKMKEILEKHDYEVMTLDLIENLGKLDLILVFACNRDVLIRIQKINCKKIYFAGEPEVVEPAHSRFNLAILAHFFSAVLTPFDYSVDNKRIFKFNFPNNLEQYPDNIAFDKKKLLCNVSGYKNSNNPKELYSLRRKVIDYFKNSSDFDFYGHGNWNELGYSNYKGIVNNKQELYHQYKFALSIENANNIKGYITEKIIDCFRSGIVPIYYGGDSKEYIPEDCYIHIEDYLDNFAALENLLKSMSEKEWSDYVKRGNAYLCNQGNELYSLNTFERNFEHLLDEGLITMRSIETSGVGVKLLMRLIAVKQKILARVNFLFN